MIDEELMKKLQKNLSKEEIEKIRTALQEEGKSKSELPDSNTSSKGPQEVNFGIDDSGVAKSSKKKEELESISLIFSGTEWESTKQEILESIATAIDPNDKESWGAVIEHIKKKLSANNCLLLKFIIYYKLWVGFLVVGIIISIPLYGIILFKFKLARLFFI